MGWLDSTGLIRVQWTSRYRGLEEKKRHKMLISWCFAWLAFLVIALVTYAVFFTITIQPLPMMFEPSRWTLLVGEWCQRRNDEEPSMSVSFFSSQIWYWQFNFLVNYWQKKILFDSTIVVIFFLIVLLDYPILLDPVKLMT
jgi:hypothetical protein